MQGTLSTTQKNFWHDHGYLKMENVLCTKTQEQLKTWVNAIELWPETPHKWMKYFENSDRGNRQLCRCEYLAPHHPGIAEIMKSSLILKPLEHFFGQKPSLFKEKINFKLPGGGAFKAHQDAPAFTQFNQSYHITVLISIDEATEENGCLEVVPNQRVTKELPQDHDGTISTQWEEKHDWVPLKTKPSDITFFDSYLPHRSQINKSQAPRRSLYITYNPESDGNFYEEYFQKKRQSFPQDCERVSGVDYHHAKEFNLGNPL